MHRIHMHIQVSRCILTLALYGQVVETGLNGATAMFVELVQDDDVVAQFGPWAMVEMQRAEYTKKQDGRKHLVVHKRQIQIPLAYQIPAAKPLPDSPVVGVYHVLTTYCHQITDCTDDPVH